MEANMPMKLSWKSIFAGEATSPIDLPIHHSCVLAQILARFGLPAYGMDCGKKLFLENQAQGKNEIQVEYWAAQESTYAWLEKNVYCKTVRGDHFQMKLQQSRYGFFVINVILQ